MARPEKKVPIPFDTLSYAKKLMAAGFTQEQAEVQAETFLTIVQDQLVSKRDLKEVEKTLELKIETVRRETENVRKDLTTEIENVRKELKIDIENVRKELKVDIEKVRAETQNVRKELKETEKRLELKIEMVKRDLKIWFGGMLFAAVAALSGIMTLIAHVSH